jgi:hypothetical protein
VNLDALDLDDAWVLVGRLDDAIRLSESRDPEGWNWGRSQALLTAKLLRQYLSAASYSRECRLFGDVQAALCAERTAEITYRRLPRGARW